MIMRVLLHAAAAAEGADQEAAAAAAEEAAALKREHMRGALHALRNILEAQPRLSALMASRPALAPLLACIEPSCRRAALPLPLLRWPVMCVLGVQVRLPL
jgi:hypothetical protein